MSIIGNFYMLDESTVTKIQNGDLSLEDMIYDDEDNVDEEKCIDIDKSWHAIHFTLTGEIDEGNAENLLSKIFFSGVPINDEEIGYGPAMLITKKEVRDIAPVLSKISKDEFRAKFDVHAMLENDIYPIVEDEDDLMFFDYVYTYFKEVQRFFEDAAKRESCVVFYIN